MAGGFHGVKEECEECRERRKKREAKTPNKALTSADEGGVK
jgi:hypothetical protein